MKPVSFRLRGWKSWTLEDSADGIPTLLRRRVTLVGQRALNSAWGLPETAEARLILSSRHGEYTRTLSLLEAVVSKNELSPSDFTLSVHHALIGLLSIVQNNRKGHTAVASGEESFCFGLLEAIACLKENPSEPLVLIHYDDLLPAPFDTFNKSYERPVAFAVGLDAKDEGEEMSVEVINSPSTEKSAASHAQNFLEFLTSGINEKCSIGEHRQWRWTRHAVD